MTTCRLVSSWWQRWYLLSDMFAVARARQCDPIDTLAHVLLNFPRLQTSGRKGATIPSNILRAPSETGLGSAGDHGGGIPPR
jgi:hypothetical protein